VPLSVGLTVEAEGLPAIRSVRDDGLGAAILEPLAQFCAVIGGIAEKLGSCLGATDQARSGRTIMCLAATQQDGKKAAFSICDCVDLRIAPAA
jgi:hypothetical protein